MWQKLLSQKEDESVSRASKNDQKESKRFGLAQQRFSEIPSISNSHYRLEEELLGARIAEVESHAQLRTERLKVMDLETNVS
jgi:hypothetical protein